MYDRIKQLMNENHINATKLSKETGISNSTISSWKSDRNNISGANILKIANYFNISTDYLLSGKDFLSDDERSIISSIRHLNSHDRQSVNNYINRLNYPSKQTAYHSTKFIELYNTSVSAGAGTYINTEDNSLCEVIITPLTAKANFAVTISGDSMSPQFENGETVLVASTPTIELNDIGIFILNGEGYIKKFLGNKLKSLNIMYKDIIINEYDSFYIKGKVIGKLTDDILV